MTPQLDNTQSSIILFYRLFGCLIFCNLTSQKLSVLHLFYCIISMNFPALKNTLSGVIFSKQCCKVNTFFFTHQIFLPLFLKIFLQNLTKRLFLNNITLKNFLKNFIIKKKTYNGLTVIPRIKNKKPPLMRWLFG